MKLYEYEQRIKSRIEEDPQDPQIYEDLQKMIYMFLRRKGAGVDEKTVEDVSFTMAGDLWMRILEGERFTYYLGYLDKIYHDYFKECYIDKRYNEPYDPSYNMKVIGGEINNLKRYQEVIDKVYLEQIESVISNFFEFGCKYKKGTRAWINLKLSLTLSLYRKTIVNYHLTTDQFAYLKMLLVKFHEKVKV